MLLGMKNPAAALGSLLLLLATAAFDAAPPAPKAVPAPAGGAAPPVLKAVPVPLPGGEGGIGFDDLAYVPALGRVVVPAGRTGQLALIDPASRRVTTIEGFSATAAGAAGHGAGTTSADYGRGLLFAIDRTALRLDVVDLKAGKIVAFAPLAASPDYVRFVASRNEVWVTEPDAETIEVFSVSTGAAPTPAHVADIAVPGGPESLVIDASRGKAYANLWKGKTVAIGLRSRSVGGAWPNGCEGARGLALDAKRGFLFVGCAEGKATVLDLRHRGAVLDSLAHGSGVDIIAYDPLRSRLYLPGGKSATLAVLSVSPEGKLALVATAATAEGAHCVTVDDYRQAWICDPGKGRLLMVRDTAP